ncbi:MAG: alpha-L-fucosidase [Gemmatimonadaceae bacterium]|nr:alpha-L-fucosidase [Gemmatimonadaceae bacterium]
MDRRDFLITAGAAGAAALGTGALHRGARARVAPVGAASRAARPVPTPAQLAWQREELSLFTHFTVNTFTDKEWGDGTESPSIFNPSRFDARAWTRVAREAGFGSLILTAKHHDGFCLWPSRRTNHSVASSPWRDGKGDVVREVADACRADGLKLGVYLSPWDRHEPSYGSGAGYMDFYCAQLEELLTQYGPVAEVWFDGANGEGPNGKRQAYDWPRIHALVRRLQPGAVMFSDAGPDVRWIGNEKGVAGETCWSTIDPASVPYAGYDAPGVGELLQRGDPHGSVWRPGETDVSIRPGWFWHPAEDDKVRSADNLMELYFTSVGRNSKLLLNLPPTRDGLLHSADARALAAFGARRRAMLSRDLARGGQVRAGGHDAGAVVSGDGARWWTAPDGATEATIELVLPRPVRCNVLRLQEPIALGQVVERWSLSLQEDGRWREAARGTTIGYTWLAHLETARADRFRLTLASTLGPLRLSTLALHLDAP